MSILVTDLIWSRIESILTDIKPARPPCRGCRDRPPCLSMMKDNHGGLSLQFVNTA